MLLIYIGEIDTTLHIQFSSSQSLSGQLIVSNAIGQAILTMPIEITNGNNGIKISTPANILPGCYILRIEANNKNWVRKFMEM